MYYIIEQTDSMHALHEGWYSMYALHNLFISLPGVWE
jgi:hypothetical protein